MTPNAEPVLYSGAITAVAVATIPVLRAFSVNITEEQADAVFALLAALIALGTIILRSRVVPKTPAPTRPPSDPDPGAPL